MQMRTGSQTDHAYTQTANKNIQRETKVKQKKKKERKKNQKRTNLTHL